MNRRSFFVAIAAVATLPAIALSQEVEWATEPCGRSFWVVGTVMRDGTKIRSSMLIENYYDLEAAKAQIRRSLA